MKLRGYLLVGLFIMSSLFQQKAYASGINEHEISKEIAHLLERIRYHKAHDTIEGQFDSLEIVNERLADFIINTAQQVDMISMPFRELDSSYLNILTSSDKNFRIYCWNTLTHGQGQPRLFNALAQYRSATGIKIAVLNRIDVQFKEEIPDPGYWYHQLYTVKGKNGKTYYLPLYLGLHSNRDRLDGIKAYTIENGQLNDSVQLFKTTKASINTIEYAYDAFNSYKDKNDGERPTIHLNEEKTKVYIPIISEEKFTGRWLIYVFNGEQFVYDKNVTD